MATDAAADRRGSVGRSYQTRLQARRVLPGGDIINHLVTCAPTGINSPFVTVLLYILVCLVHLPKLLAAESPFVTVHADERGVADLPQWGLIRQPLTPSQYALWVQDCSRSQHPVGAV